MSVRVRCAFATFLVAAAAVIRGEAAEPLPRLPPPTACASTAEPTLAVRVIDEAEVPAGALEVAREEAHTIWAGAGLQLMWRDPIIPPEPSSERTVVVIVRRTLPPGGIGGINAPAASRPALGALIFRDDGRPSNLIVVSWEWVRSIVMSGTYLDRLVPMLHARTQTRLLGRGLGRVMAHEIGHWVMGRAHTPDGLMAASFGVRELLHARLKLPRAWTAAPSSVQQALSARCEVDAVP
jgi:hypothetical protein